MRVGSALANGARQYGANITTTWQQLESGINGFAIGDNGMALGLPVLRWKGQTGASVVPNDYVQGLLIQNRDASATLFVSTTHDSDGSSPASGTARSTATAIAVAPNGSLQLSNTDATKVWVIGSGALVVAVLAT